jgi:cobalt/nickel transport system ATP-binding protein
VAERRSLLLVGHGSRSAAGVAECLELVRVVAGLAPHLDVSCGFIEFAQPDLDAALDRLVAAGASEVVAVPLVLLGAGHLKDDGPAALARARRRHAGACFRYGRDLGIHPLVLAAAEERVRAAIDGTGADPAETAVVLVSRGSTDPDANADLHKVARLLWDGRGFGAVEPAFVSLAAPGVPAALDRCHRLGFRHVAVVPYFLFTGVLVERIQTQTSAWAAAHPDVSAITGPHLGADARIGRLVLERYEEARVGDVRMNCDLCVYRLPLPGYEHRVGHAPPLRSDGPAWPERNDRPAWPERNDRPAWPERNDRPAWPERNDRPAWPERHGGR